MKKSIFLFFAAILCAIGMNAATPTKIYLNAKDWGYGDARFAAYFFDPAKWVDMKKVDGETFIYEVDVPAGYTKVILCRMNGGTTANNWDNKWNQTGDLTIPTDGKNMFKPDDWNGKTTTWSTYTPTVTHTFAKGTTLYIDFRAITTEKKGANYPKANAAGLDYSGTAGGTIIPITFTADVKWAEGAEFMKTDQGGWASIPFHAPTEGANCAQVAADGKSYTWTTFSEPTVTLSLDKTEADAGTEVTVTLTATADNVTGDVTYAFQYSTDEATWNDMEATGNTATQTFAAETRYYKVTMTNGGTTKEATAKFTAIKFHVIGSWDNWATHNVVVDGNWAVALEADSTYEFKITAGNWDIHWGNSGTMTRDNCTGWSFDADSNAKITTDMAGEYVFNVVRNAEGKVVVSVTYPALPVKCNVTVTAENGTVTGDGEYEEGKEATLTATPAEGYEFVNWTVGEEVVSTENPYTFTVTADVALVANFKAVEPETITWELNGGKLPLVGPTNAELWGTDTADVNGFMHYYNHYYGLKRATQTIENVASFAYAQMQQIMTDEASAYKWLGDYVQSVATAAGQPLSTDMAAANESGWRWSVWAFFNACAGKNGSTGIDFTEAGKPENWVNVYPDAQEVVVPTEPVTEDYVLPTPVKEGYTFVGWYDNAEGTGKAYTVIPAGWAGTLYAIWKQGTTTALENIAVEGKAVKAIVNGQLIIIKNGVQYNAQGQVVK